MRNRIADAIINESDSGRIEIKYQCKSYIHYDSLIYLNRPHLNTTKIRIVYVNELWPKDHDRIEPHIPTLEALAPTLSGVVCLDIEHWPWYKATAEERSETIRKLVLVASTIKRVNPNIEIGYYSMLPQRKYWEPIKQYQNQLDAWRADNLELMPVAEAVDVIFPSLYTFFDVPADWQKYAIGNINEARIYGKPVIPLIWPQFHDSSPLKFQPIPGDFWRLQLETCRAYADSVILWGGYKTEWNPVEPWYLETIRFLIENK